MKDKTACFTGHRNIPNNEIEKVREQLYYTIIDLIGRGYCYFGAGGAHGFDTIAAQTILELKKEYPHIKLILVLPCLSQTRGWQESDIKMYEYIKQQADKYVYTSEKYFNGCMQKRNRHLVDYSSTCICYLNSDSGGTAYTVKYARSKGLNIINIYEKTVMR